MRRETSKHSFSNISYSSNYIRSPLNYIGGKYKLLKQILPLFPQDISTFVDLFAGGCNVGINVKAEKIIFNDNLTYLIDMYHLFQEKEIANIINHIEKRIDTFQLSLTNDKGYKDLRELYNLKREPLDLFVLVAYSFNHQIRFNNSHKFNNPFGKNRSSFNKNMKHNLIEFISKLKSINAEFVNLSFTNFDFSSLTNKDFVYCDPPYLITTGTYNDGRRGFEGWTKKDEINLLNILDDLDQRKVKFALSNVLDHKGKSNTILKDWIKSKKYVVNYLDYHYSNSNYQTAVKGKNSSTEILITNYNPNENQVNLIDKNQLTLL